MTFSSPLFFWAFLSLIPLAAVYFLKVRPRRKQTTAYFLWDSVFREKRSTRLLHRLRDLWSLLLMALAFSGIALALTKPKTVEDERKDLLLLVDASASMSARDGNQSRLDRAKQAAIEIIRALDGTQRAAVATVGHTIDYRSHLTDNPSELIDAVRSIEPSDETVRAKLLAKSGFEALHSNEYRVILISDGCFGSEQLPATVELLRVGDSADNLGIVAADMRYLPGAANQLGLYLQIASTHDGTTEADLTVSYVAGDNQTELVRLIPLEIKPGVNPPEVFMLPDARPGRWLVSLDVDDVLSNDNTVHLAAHKPHAIRVAVESDDPFFLENSVFAFSGESGLLTLTYNDPQIVLAKSRVPPEQRAIIFQPHGSSPWWSELGEEAESIVPRVLVEDHPALRYIDMTSIPFVGARELQVPEGGQVLVAGDDGIPLIYQASRSGKTAIVVNMDPAAADFYFSAWFPVLVHSAATYLAGRQEELLATYRPTDVVTIPGSSAGESTQVVAPSGKRQSVQKETLPPLGQLGFYNLKNSSGQWIVACSLLSPDETLLDNEEVKDTTEPISRGWSLGQLLTLAAIGVVLIESLLYHRRKVG